MSEMSNPIVSVIMPVYNSESTLPRALESFMAQTLVDWEIIAVNDGSTDGSGLILDAYASRDARIKVVNKTNGGVASARQAGMDRMMGTYFIHADSDDWVEPAMLEDMLNKARATDSDMVIADYYVEHRNCRLEYIRQKPSSLESSEVLYAIYAKDLFGGLCHKMIKKSSYDKANARFVVGIDYCEDVLLLTQILRDRNMRISYIDKAYYHYMLSESSLTRNISPRSFESLKKFNNALPLILPKDVRFQAVIEKGRLDLFVTGFMNGMYNAADVKCEYQKVRKLALATSSVRWKLGYYCINIGWLWLAHKLIRF